MLQSIQNGAVSFLKAPLSIPAGNADTITNSLGPYPNKNAHDLIHGAASTGFYVYSEPSCGGAGIGGPGIGTSLVGAGLGAIPVVGGIAKTILGVFGAHHATAVKNEQATLCQAVPDANNFFRQIDLAVSSGQMDAATAVQTMEQGYQNWRTEVKSILQDSGGHCNAACIYAKCFRAAIEKRKQDYALMSAQSATGVQGVLGGAVNAPSGIVSGVVNAVSGAASSIGAALGFTSGPASPAAPAGSPAAPAGFSSALVASGGGDALTQAGLTPARQTSLAMSLMVGGLVVVGLLWFQFIRGAKK